MMDINEMIGVLLVMLYDIYGFFVLKNIRNNYMLVYDAKCLRQEYVWWLGHRYLVTFYYIIGGRQYESYANYNPATMPMFGGNAMKYKIGKEYRIFANKENGYIICTYRAAVWLIVKLIVCNVLILMIILATRS